MRLHHLLPAVLVTVSSLATAQHEAWVDPVAGDDQNSGSGPLDAWRTLHHALTTVQGGPAPRIVHVLPGVLGTPNGELFPLPVEAGTTVTSTAGAAHTLVDPPGVPGALFQVRVEPAAEAAISGLTLRGGLEAVQVAAAQPNATGTVRCTDLVIESAVTSGLAALADTLVHVERCSIRGTGKYGVRVDVDGSGSSGLSRLEMIDCEVNGSSLYGVLLNYQYGGSVQATFSRCRIEECGQFGILNWESALVQSGWSNDLALEDCLVARSGTGVYVYRGPARVLHSTIADNGLAGIESQEAVELHGSIVDGHVDDLDGTFHITHSFVGDGDGAGNAGNLTGDPGFVDRAHGDWRLTFGSPCVDAGPPDATSVDLRGLPRRTDGDLDLAGAPDMGALELQPLTSPDTAGVGAPFELGLQGPAGGAATLFVDHGGLGVGTTTPFGRVFLSASMRRMATVTLLGGAPTAFRAGVAGYHGIGAFDVSFQALIDSPNAPAGRAWSNPRVVHVD